VPQFYVNTESRKQKCVYLHLKEMLCLVKALLYSQQRFRKLRIVGNWHATASFAKHGNQIQETTNNFWFITKIELSIHTLFLKETWLNA